MHVVTLTIEIRLPGCASLKQKRSRLKPLLNGLHREFNASVAEIHHNDNHKLAVIACAVVSNDSRHAQRVLSKIPAWIEKNRPDLQIIDHELIVW